jgi:hypothetical protein
MDRLHAEEFLQRLLAAHGAEDALQAVPEDTDDADDA